MSPGLPLPCPPHPCLLGLCGASPGPHPGAGFLYALLVRTLLLAVIGSCLPYPSESGQTELPNPTLGCVTPGKWLHLSEFPFPHLYRENDTHQTVETARSHPQSS